MQQDQRELKAAYQVAESLIDAEVRFIEESRLVQFELQRELEEHRLPT